MKELHETTEYITKQKVALSDVQLDTVSCSNDIYSSDCTSESVKKFIEILHKDYGLNITNDVAQRELNNLLEVYRNIINRKLKCRMTIT